MGTAGAAADGAMLLASDGSVRGGDQETMGDCFATGATGGQTTAPSNTLLAPHHTDVRAPDRYRSVFEQLGPESGFHLSALGEPRGR